MGADTCGPSANRAARRCPAEPGAEASCGLLWHTLCLGRKPVGRTGPRRDHQRRDQAGMRVAEPELAAVQRRDRRGEAQPETRTRRRAACLEPDESLHRMLAVGLGYAGTVVGDDEQHGVALAPRL